MTVSPGAEAGTESELDKALRLYNAGDAAGAQTIFKELAKTSTITPEILVGLGMSTLGCNSISEAEGYLRRATELNPSHDVAYRCLALVLTKKSELAEAEQAATTSVRLAPRNAQNVFTLGVIKDLRGDSQNAAQCYKAATALNPLYSEALLNCGTAALKQRDFRTAITSFATALMAKPDFFQAYTKLITALRDSGSHDEAQALLNYVTTLAPQSAELKDAVASVSDHPCDTTPLPKHEDSEYGAPPSTMNKPGGLIEEINRYLALCLVMNSADEMYEVRDALMEHFEHVATIPGELSDPFTSITIAPEFISSLPLRDRLARTKLASLLSLKAPSLRFEAAYISAWQEQTPLRRDLLPIPAEVLGERDLVENAHQLLTRKIRLGICSSDLASNSVSSLCSELFSYLPRSLFEISLFHTTRPADSIHQPLATRADFTHQLLEDITSATQQISTSQLDILVYTDLEASRLTYLLALARLAPIQCVTWGLAETTGIPTIDYFLAPDALAGSRVQSQFSEHLVTFPQVAVSCETEPPLKKPSREAFDLPLQHTMFVCPEYPQTIHPGMDYLVYRVLQGDRNSFIVFPQKKHSAHTEHFLERLKNSMPDCMDQIFVRDVSSSQELCDLIELSDAVLDAIHCCSPLAAVKALQCGKAVVTLPGKSLRSRTAGACYRAAGYLETVAKTREHYIQIALLLARDDGWRKNVGLHSRSTYEVLRKNVQNASAELTRFFLSALNKITTLENRKG